MNKLLTGAPTSRIPTAAITLYLLQSVLSLGENRAYDFSRAVNLDPTILVSSDLGDSWSYGGKLLTLPKLGYVNGYTKYTSNGVDRIDFLTTDHHPRDFSNNVYHGYVQGGKLHRSDGTVVDENVLDNDGHPQTELTRVFTAGSTFGGDMMSHGWIADIRLDAAGHPCGILTTRANDIPDNANFNDHRFLYARFDGSRWNVHPLAKRRRAHGTPSRITLKPGRPESRRLQHGLHIHPIDPRDGNATSKHEIYKGVTSDQKGKLDAGPRSRENSSVDNLRPIIPVWTSAAILLCSGSAGPCRARSFMSLRLSG